MACSAVRSPILRNSSVSIVINNPSFFKNNIYLCLYIFFSINIYFKFKGERYVKP